MLNITIKGKQEENSIIIELKIKGKEHYYYDYKNGILEIDDIKIPFVEIDEMSVNGKRVSDWELGHRYEC